MGTVLDALRRLARRADLGLVPLSTLRAELAPLTRAEVDGALLELRRADLVRLHTFDGRHGQATAEQLAAAIEEDGRRFVFAVVVPISPSTREGEIATTRACAAAALRDLASLASELAGRLEHGESPRRIDVSVLEVGIEAVRQALDELSRVSRG
jgi:hypothetical protein